MLLFSHQIVSDYFSWLISKDPDTGKDWRQEEKEMTEDEMVGWHHRLNRHEFEQALGDGEGQGSLSCCSPQGRKKSETTERLNNKKVQFFVTPWTVACQAPLAMGFSRQEYWSELLFPPSGDFFSHPEIEHPISCLAGRLFFFFTTDPPGKPNK